MFTPRFAVARHLPLLRAPVRYFRPCVPLLDSDAFKEAAARVKGASSVDNGTLLKLYALFKQATVGANTTPKPGMMDFVVRV